MTRVDINRLKGNYAESLVASWLGRQCLVRPVTAGTDIGVDLYCESIIDGLPFLHFWVQVKAIAQRNISVSDGTTIASCSFDTEHLRYWDRQPVPVYALLVPVEEWPPAAPKQIYGIRITKEIVRNGIPDGKEVQYRTSNGFAAGDLDNDLQTFLTKIVPWDTSALLLKRGIIAPLQDTDTNSEPHLPFLVSIPYLDRILNSIRDAAVIGLLDSLLAETQAPGFRQERAKFASVASLFESEMHNLGISALVRSAHKDGRIEDAKRIIRQAMTRIEVDPRMSQQTKRENTGKLKELLQELE